MEETGTKESNAMLSSIKIAEKLGIPAKKASKLLIDSNKKYGSDQFPINIIDQPTEKEDGLVLIHANVWSSLDEVERAYQKDTETRNKSRSESAKSAMAAGGNNRALLLLRSSEQVIRNFLSKQSVENLDKTKKSVEKVFAPGKKEKLSPVYTDANYQNVLKLIAEYRKALGKQETTATPTETANKQTDKGGSDASKASETANNQTDKGGGEAEEGVGGDVGATPTPPPPASPLSGGGRRSR
jgi:hypothetical protein